MDETVNAIRDHFFGSKNLWCFSCFRRDQAVLQYYNRLYDNCMEIYGVAFLESVLHYASMSQVRKYWRIFLCDVANVFEKIFILRIEGKLGKTGPVSLRVTCEMRSIEIESCIFVSNRKNMSWSETGVQ